MNENVWIGIDVGGTKTAIVISADPPNVLGRTEFATLPAKGPGRALKLAKQGVRELLAQQRLEICAIKRIGVSCGGPLDRIQGVIQSPPNLPTWDNVPIKAIMEEEFRAECQVENDANAGAVAEHRFGAGQGTQNMVFLTMGTGLGAGIITDGRLYHGTNDLAGEVGHIRLTRTGPVGHNKLTIIDLVSGEQPMRSEDGDTVLVYNGEVYNYAELRAELAALGHRFFTRSDTEVVLRAFLEWDTECFRRLRGMFGLALWCESRRRLVLARDRVGIKPLYFCRKGPDIYFSSELKGILYHPDIDRTLDLEGLTGGTLGQWRSGFVNYSSLRRRGVEQAAEDVFDHVQGPQLRGRRLRPGGGRALRNGSYRGRPECR
jgi:hypothetical protein